MRRRAIFGVLVLLGFVGFLIFGFGYHVARPVAKGVAIGAKATVRGCEDASATFEFIFLPAKKCRPF